MKNFSLNNNDSRFGTRVSTILWFVFHIAIFLIVGVFFLQGKQYSINTNLFDILPESSVAKSVGKADRVLSEKTGRQFFVLAQADDFETAKSGAETLYNELFLSDEENAIFESLSLGTVNGDGLDEIFDFYHHNRFLLLDRKTIEKLNSPDGAQEIADAALEKAYSGFSMMPMEYIQDDPFFLTEIAIENLIANLSGNGFSMTDGVLSIEYEDKFYVMLRGLLTPMGAGITNKKSGVKRIYECAQETLSQTPDVNFIYSGVPFHTYKSSSSAQREIAGISAISIVAIIFLFIAIFKNGLPILCSVAAIALSALTALCSTFLIFGEIHILCFVFGTTLIGTCLDYSVHFFVRWKSDCDLQDGIAIRQKLLKGLSLSFASTGICYLVLLFAPFALLKQIAIFSFAGILSSFLTVVLMYPIIELPRGASTYPAARRRRRRYTTSFFYPEFILVIIAIAFIFIAIFYRNNLRIENDIKSFYKMSGKILDDEILSAKVLNHGSSGWYFLVRGSSQEDLLVNEEKFCNKLDAEIAKGNLSSYTACTQFMPTTKLQMESYNACKKLLPIANEQYRKLGFSADEIEAATEQFKKDFSQLQYFVRIEGDTSAPMSLIQTIETYDDSEFRFAENNSLPSFEKNALSSLWIGEVNGEWFSAILPMNAKNADIFKKLAQKDKNVSFVNKVTDISFELNRLTRIMLILLAIAFAVLIIALNFFYPIKTVLKIIIVPIMVLLSEAAALAAFNIPIGFFSVTGIILVFGLGLDYVIYTVESGDRLNRIAIFVSFITTELSFGLIAFSTFVPVHIFGVVVSVGLFAAWICQLVIKE